MSQSPAELPFWLSVRGPDVVISRTGIALNREEARTMLRCYDTVLEDYKHAGEEGAPPLPPFINMDRVKVQREDLMNAVALQGWSRP